MKRIKILLLVLLFAAGTGNAVNAAEVTIDEITLDAESSQQYQETVTIRMSRLLLPEILGIEGENPRIVCDFVGAEPNEALKHEIEFNGKLIKRVRIGVHTAPESKTRVVLDLVPQKDYSVRQSPSVEGNLFIITIQQATNSSIPPAENAPDGK